jgi:hypothetical protein
MPGQAMDQALADRRISKELPSIRQVGAEALRAANGKAEDIEEPLDFLTPEKVKAYQLAEIEKTVDAYYSENHADAYETLKPEIDRAVAAMQEIYRRNVFPAMEVTWGTYRSHIGHLTDTDEHEVPEPTAEGYTRAYGCFRCHDESHVSKDGKVISQDCTICHTPLAMDEENPEVLVQLGIAEPAAPEEESAPEEPSVDVSEAPAES